MKRTEYDQVIVTIIKIVRELRGVKQLSLANALQMKECNYNKIENGHIAISLSQIKILARELKISPFHIIAIAEETVNLKLLSLPVILAEIVRKTQNTQIETVLTCEELKFIVLKIKIFSESLSNIL